MRGVFCVLMAQMRRAKPTVSTIVPVLMVKKVWAG
jgi:hypothetical protein